MRKVKIVDILDFDKFIVHSTEFQKAINRIFEEVAKENGTIIKTEYLRNNDGRVRTAIIEYEVPDEKGAQ